MADYARPGPFAVAVDDGEWHDARRDRRIAWRRYRPQAGGAAPLVARTPFVVHSHGLGGSCASGGEWLRHWASWGIAAVAVQHPGSDAAARPSGSPLALRQLLRTAVDAAQLAARQHDLLLALDRLAAETVPAIGIAGHSFGAVSALRVIGERRGRDDLAADPRLAAAVLFSPSARGGTLPLAERFAGVTLPCLHLTGSLDSGIGRGDIRAADRCLPFAHMPPPHQHLLVLDGATHAEFAGEPGAAAPAPAPAGRVRLLQAVSTAFWRQHLLADPPAAAWLRDQLPQLLAAGDRLQQK